MTITEPQRILMVLATSGGGVGQHVRAMSAALAAQGGQVRVAAPSSVHADSPDDAPWRPVVLDVAASPRPRHDLAAVAVLRSWARGADVVHAHGVRAGALAVLAIRALPAVSRPPLVVTLHNAAVGGRGVRGVHAALERIVARGADSILGVSPDLEKAMLRLGAADVGRALVPPPVGVPPARDRAQVRAALAVPDGAALLVTVARLAPQKGLEFLLDGLRELQRSVPQRQVHAAVAGDGPLLDELRRNAQGLSVSFLGRRSDIVDLFAAADVAVCPSVWEGQPLVVQEALRVGAPLVATDVGGTSVITGDAAVLVPYGDTAALAAGIESVLADEECASALRRRARQQAARLPTQQQAVAQLNAVYGRWVR